MVDPTATASIRTFGIQTPTSLLFMVNSHTTLGDCSAILNKPCNCWGVINLGKVKPINILQLAGFGLTQICFEKLLNCQGRCVVRPSIFHWGVNQELKFIIFGSIPAPSHGIDWVNEKPSRLPANPPHHCQSASHLFATQHFSFLFIVWHVAPLCLPVFQYQKSTQTFFLPGVNAVAFGTGWLALLFPPKQGSSKWQSFLSSTFSDVNLSCWIAFVLHFVISSLWRKKSSPPSLFSHR